MSFHIDIDLVVRCPTQYNMLSIGNSAASRIFPDFYKCTWAHLRFRHDNVRRFVSLANGFVITVDLTCKEQAPSALWCLQNVKTYCPLTFLICCSFMVFKEKSLPTTMVILKLQANHSTTQQDATDANIIPMMNYCTLLNGHHPRFLITFYVSFTVHIWSMQTVPDTGRHSISSIFLFFVLNGLPDLQHS